LQGEVLTYVKKEICSKVGSLREMVKLFFVLSVQTSKEFRLVRTNNRCWRSSDDRNDRQWYRSKESLRNLRHLSENFIIR